MASESGALDARNPNLQPFFEHGGKLIQYHGWNDNLIPPLNSVNYYNSVVEKLEKAAISNSMRLFMVPGMAHCGGGNGPNTFDSIGTLETWREKGTAPVQVTAANAAVTLTRPLCPYPQYAKYKGTGNQKDAANWICAAP